MITFLFGGYEKGGNNLEETLWKNAKCKSDGRQTEGIKRREGLEIIPINSYIRAQITHKKRA